MAGSTLLLNTTLALSGNCPFMALATAATFNEGARGAAMFNEGDGEEQLHLLEEREEEELQHNKHHNMQTSCLLEAWKLRRRKGHSGCVRHIGGKGVFGHCQILCIVHPQGVRSLTVMALDGWSSLSQNHMVNAVDRLATVKTVVQGMVDGGGWHPTEMLGSTGKFHGQRSGEAAKGRLEKLSNKL
eukprot:CAMPEP_0171332802 /NCGR_PEP_ID=MMETSP0878-20121228/3614_1 /TAXON_ID=67004 /ORGANISM="Thalassiosira weissflogii, Strain CCMP1336" /LENGTH=185 /DNA_ID=CAMNT_0011833633 /DNA_START=3 /DNA_END=561 /DNA_ORIENTATION=-